MYEVELKFPLTDAHSILVRLAALGARQEEPRDQRDLYFNHPVRDFAQTDEALRVRTTGDSNCVTFKGPVIDSQTKTRREIEVGLESGPAAVQQFGEMLELLGFRPERVVKKRRTPHALHREGRDLEIVLDEVEGLGLYLEIETLADESQRPAARDAILALAADLGLTGAERRSYLCLLLERDRKLS